MSEPWLVNAESARREDVIDRYIAAGDVLDLGVVDSRRGVELLRERGYDVLCADVETMDLGRQFDTIIAGEIIEHLPNAGRSLSNLRRHLKPGGHIVLSTCNPFYARQHLKIWRSGDVQVHDEHTAWFDPHTLNRVLTMSGFRTVQLAWLRKRRGLSAVKNWQAWLRPYFSPNFLMAATHASVAARAAA
jgi:2-polyprenyl-3-methyl-5-hydroxy-6-metoxy-1,4-benzoquinol methylase